MTIEKLEELSVASPIKQFHAVCLEMLRAALNGDWEDVAVLEQRRQSISLQNVLQQIDAETQSNLLNELLIINQEVIGLASAAREELRASLDVMKVQEKAVNAYLR